MPDNRITRRIAAVVQRRLVRNWRSRLSDYSTIALAFSAGIVGVWATFPSDWLQFLPTAWVARITGAVSLFGLLGKFVNQPGKVPPR